MKKSLSLLFAVGILSVAFTTTASAQENVHSSYYPYTFLAVPDTVGPVFVNSLSVSRDYSTEFQYDAIASGSWSGGNGYYSATVSWGDGRNDYYSGTSQSSSWTHNYPRMQWYDIRLTVTSNGGSDYRIQSLQI